MVTRQPASAVSPTSDPCWRLAALRRRGFVWALLWAAAICSGAGCSSLHWPTPEPERSAIAARSPHGAPSRASRANARQASTASASRPARSTSTLAEARPEEGTGIAAAPAASEGRPARGPDAAKREEFEQFLEAVRDPKMRPLLAAYMGMYEGDQPPPDAQATLQTSQENQVTPAWADQPSAKPAHTAARNTAELPPPPHGVAPAEVAEESEPSVAMSPSGEPTTSRLPPVEEPSLASAETTSSPSPSQEGEKPAVLLASHAEQDETDASSAKEPPKPTSAAAEGQVAAADSTGDMQGDAEPNPLPVGATPKALSPEKQTGSPEKQTSEESWRTSLNRTIEALESELARHRLAASPETAQAGDVTPAGGATSNATEESGESFSPQDEARLRLLYAAADRKEDAAQPISVLTDFEKVFWTDAISGIQVMLDPAGHPRLDSRASLALSHVRSAANQLANGGVLEVRNLQFCSKVDGYGRYTPFPRAAFRPDQEVLLYVEVDSFSSVWRPQSKLYETTLQGSYEVRDLSGRRVAQYTFPVEKDLCRNRRRDFFMWYRFYAPQVNPGEYTLQVTVEDVAGEKFGQSAAVAFVVEQ